MERTQEHPESQTQQKRKGLWDTLASSPKPLPDNGWLSSHDPKGLETPSQGR